MFKNILAIGAHADDVELGCSGTLLKYKEQGANIGLPSSEKSWSLSVQISTWPPLRGFDKGVFPCPLCPRNLKQVFFRSLKVVVFI